MARSKSKHMRLIMRRRKQHNQRMKRRKAEAKAQGAGAPAKKAPTPRKVPAPPTLALYASQLGAVEVQSRLPDEATLADWAEAAPPGFEFALKLAGRIDVRAGRGAARAVRALLEVAAPLEERMGPILIQLPHSVTADRSALKDFLGAVPQGMRLAFELRHPSWHTEAVLRV